VLISFLVLYIDNKTKRLARYCDNAFSNEVLTLSCLFSEKTRLVFSDEKSVTSGSKALEEVVRGQVASDRG